MSCVEQGPVTHTHQWVTVALGMLGAPGGIILTGAGDRRGLKGKGSSPALSLQCPSCGVLQFQNTFPQ